MKPSRCILLAVLLRTGCDISARVKVGASCYKDAYDDKSSFSHLNNALAGGEPNPDALVAM